MKKIINLFKTNSLKRRGAFLVGATVLSNFFNLLYNAYLGRTISIEDFAVISFIGSILSISDIPIGALGKAVTYKSAFLFGKYKKPATIFWQRLRGRALKIAFILTFLWLISSPFLVRFFNLDDFFPIVAFAPIWFFTILSSVDGGYLTGNLKFGFLGLVFAIEAIVKFISAIILVKLGLGEYAYLAVVISVFSSFALIVAAAKRLKVKASKVTKIQKGFPTKFYLSSVMSRISTVVYLSADVILAKHFLSAEQAGQYALLSLTGKMVFFAGSLFSQFVLPMISHKEGTGSNSTSLFYKLLAATSLSSLLAFIVVGLLGHFTMPLVFGEKALLITNYIFWYALSMVAFTISTSIVSFNQVKGRHALPVASFLLAITQIVAISTFSSSIEGIVRSVSILGFVSLGVIFSMHLFSNAVDTVILNLKDFVEIFKPFKKSQRKSGLRILVLNWRDTKHMWAGGAEVYVHEMAKRWVREGNLVTVFCGNDRNNKRNETIDGVNIVRRGGFYTVYLWATIYYILRFRRNFDVIVDSENGIPFFSPLFSTKPVVLLIHHVHQEVFVTNMKFPLAYVGKFIEGKLMPFIYRNKTVITVSESSKKEIIKAGIANEESIQIVNPGIDIVAGRVKKSATPQLIYLGRLKAYKNVDVAIRAFAMVIEKIKKAKFLIVGEGEAIRDLQDIVIKMDLSDKISFLGKVSEKEKTRHLSESWVAVQPSDVEGWGITVLEANACKTPVVASKTNGLKDSIVDGTTGVLVPVKDTKGFAASITRLMRNEKLRTTYSKNAYSWAKNFSWDETSKDFLNVLSYEATSRQRIFSIERVGYLMSRVTSLF